MRSRLAGLVQLVAAAAFGLAPLLAVAQMAGDAAAAASTASAGASAAASTAAAPAPAPSAAAAAPAAPAAIPAPAATAPARAQPLPASPMAGPSAGNLLQTIFALTLVLGLLFGLAWFLKRYGPKASGGSANLRIVGALNLGGRERIMVVEVGEQWIVVGASPGRVNALATMPKQEAAPGTAPSTLSEHQRPANSFSEWLKQTIDKRNAK